MLAGVAQLVEHFTRNEKVTCSSHATGSREKTSEGMSFFSYIFLRQVILLRGFIRLTPSDIVFCTF